MWKDERKSRANIDIAANATNSGPMAHPVAAMPVKPLHGGQDIPEFFYSQPRAIGDALPDVDARSRIPRNAVKTLRNSAGIFLVRGDFPLESRGKMLARLLLNPWDPPIGVPEMKQKASKATSKTTSKTATTKNATSMLPAKEDAVSMLKADHRQVEQMFAQYSAAGSEHEKTDLVQRICTALAIHSYLEEGVFYPACREGGVEDDLMDEAQVEHDTAGYLMDELLAAAPDAPFYDAKVKVLSEYVKHHVSEEEKPGSGIFAKAKSAGLDMDELGQRLKNRKQQLETKAEAYGIKPPAPRSLGQHPYPQGENQMARYNQERDEQGRFTSDDDRGYSRQQYRDDNGRYAQSRYENQGRSSMRGDRDDYESGSRGRGHGGWFGDPEGHSRASELGWERREGYDDDRGGRYSRSRHEGGGSSMRGGRDDYYYDDGGRGRGHGGWFGDSEGHSRAAELGWDHRGRDYDDDRGGRYSRSRMDEEGRYSNRGHGGWFGDSEGHSRAAERGWDGHRDEYGGRGRH